jgi:hypothetical protein
MVIVGAVTVVFVTMIMVIGAMMVMLLSPVMASVARFIFRIADEIHRTTAGIAFMAMRAPVPGMRQWNIEIDRGLGVAHAHDLERLGVHERWRRTVAQLHFPVDAGRNLAGEIHPRRLDRRLERCLHRQSSSPPLRLETTDAGDTP